jgi:hypothetical protein
VVGRVGFGRSRFAGRWTRPGGLGVAVETLKVGDGWKMSAIG